MRELGFLDGHLAGTALSPSQVHALLELERFPLTRASDLRVLFRLDKSAVSRLLSDQKPRRHIAITLSAEDGRGLALQLATKGRRELKITHDEADQKFIAALQAIDGTDRPSVVKRPQLFAHALANTRKRHGQACQTRRPASRLLRARAEWLIQVKPCTAGGRMLLQ